MTKEDIIRMALEAGAAYDEGLTYFEQSDLQRFANLVAAAEREECAKAAFYGYYIDLDGEEISASIRARGNRT
jgi:hypothetical protein